MNKYEEGSHQETFYEILDKYNAAIEPLENWLAEDIVALIGVLDCELQQREATVRDMQENPPHDYMECDDDD